LSTLSLVSMGVAGGEVGGGLSFTESRPLGGAFALDGLWRRLGIDTAIHQLFAKRRIHETQAECGSPKSWRVPYAASRVSAAVS
jgi:hypothetical protein